MSSLQQTMIALKFCSQVLSILAMLYIPHNYLVKVPMVKRALAYIYQFHIMQSFYSANTLENDTVLSLPLSLSPVIFSQSPSTSEVITQSISTTMTFMDSHSHKTVISTAEWVLYQRGIVFFSIVILAAYTCFICFYYYRSRETITTLVDGPTNSKSGGSRAGKTSKQFIRAGRSLVGLRRKRSSFWSSNRSERLNHFRQRRARREEKQRKNMDSRD